VQPDEIADSGEVREWLTEHSISEQHKPLADGSSGEALPPELPERGDVQDLWPDSSGLEAAEPLADGGSNDPDLAPTEQMPELWPPPPDHGAIEGIPESHQPEGIREEMSDREQVLEAKAVSLIASFLGEHPQSGLMERTAPTQWELTVYVPQGQQHLRFRLDNSAREYIQAPSNASQWPITGVLVPTTSAISVLFPQAGTYRFSVDLGLRTYAIAWDAPPTAVSIEGSWSGQANRQQNLHLDADSNFRASLSLKAGEMRWRMALQRAGQWQHYGSKYQARGVFPQGGVVQAGGGECLTQIPVDGDYLLTYRTHEMAYELVFQPKDMVAAFEQLLRDVVKQTEPAAKQALVERFMRECELTGGLPLIKATRIIFALRWKTSAPVAVAGTFNQWSATAHLMKQIDDTDLHYLDTTLPAGLHEYKFVDAAAQPNWITDPGNPAFVYGTYGPNSSAYIGSHAQRGQLRAYSGIAATLLKNKRTIYVYLPPSYHEHPTRRHPVLYMHDGQNLFDPQAAFGSWEVHKWIDSLVPANKILPYIVVGIANTGGRMDEYTPTRELLNGQMVGGRATDYADFIVRELKPWIDGRYRTLPGRRHTAVMGSSLGGVISFWLGLEYSDVFFRIGALSSTFGWGASNASGPSILDIAKQTDFRNLVIYIDSGSPQDNYNVTLQMRSILETKGYLHGLNLQHWVEQGAIHNESAWHKRLHRPMQFLLSWQ
jgi:predicted alpha/beta superfamily hydrolase